MKKLKFMVESTNGSIKKGQGSLSNIKNYLTKEFDSIKSFKIMDESIYSPRLLDDAWRELKRRARKDKFISTEALENVSRDFAEDPETRVVSRSLSDRLYDELIEKMDAEGYELMDEDEYNDKFDSPKWQPDTLKYYYAKKKLNEDDDTSNSDISIEEILKQIKSAEEKCDDLISRYDYCFPLSKLVTYDNQVDRILDNIRTLQSRKANLIYNEKEVKNNIDLDIYKKIAEDNGFVEDLKEIEDFIKTIENM